MKNPLWGKFEKQMLKAIFPSRQHLPKAFGSAKNIAALKKHKFKQSN